MGEEDWEVKYKTWDKGSVNDFLGKDERDLDVEDVEPNNVIHFARSGQDSTISQQPLKTKVKTSSYPAYPEGYDTIDRRRRKKFRDPVVFVNARTESRGEDAFNRDIALLRQKRGELVLRQVAELEEEDEKMMPCLRPYKNGLFYKTRMQPKNKVENMLRDYMAYQETRLGLSIDLSEVSDEMQRSEEELEEFCSEISQHFKQYKKDSYFRGYCDELRGYHDRKTTKGKIEEWTPEVTLSPVAEPRDEYVDPIDELQCLVKTVSEYLAEKEDEISKYASLPETSKSRLSSQGSVKTGSFGDEQGVSSKELKEDQAIEVEERNLSEQEPGKKNAMNSLFSSFTDKIVPSSKQTRSNSVQCSETSEHAIGSSGLSKLFSFMTKSQSPAPVAVVSPTQETPPDERKFLMPTRPSDAKLQEIIQKTPPTSNTQMQNNHDVKNHNVNECQPPSSVSSELKDVNPQVFFSEGGFDGSSKSFSEVSRNELNRNRRHSVDQSNEVQDFHRSGDRTRTATVFIETHTKTDNSENISQKSPASLGLFSPLKNSFSSLIAPVPRMPPQYQTQTVFPVFRSENVREATSLDASSAGNKMEVPFIDSDNVSTQRPPKVEKAVFSGLLKFTSGDDTVEVKSSPQNTVKSDQTAPSKSNSASEVSLNLNKARCSAQNLTETQPVVTSETSWFSSLFKTVTNENLQAASPQSQRLVNQSSRPPTGSSQNRVRSEHQKPVKEVNEQIHNMKQTPNTETPSAEPNTSQAETQGLFSTLFKSLSSEDTAGPKTAMHSVEGGLFSGIMKFASADMSKGTPSNTIDPRNEPSQRKNPAQTHLENQPHTPQRAHNPSPSGAPSVSGKEPPQHRDSTDCQLSQQPPPPQQASSQQGSILSGLFKLVSGDNLSNNQADSWQHQNATSVHPSHQPSKQDVQGHQSRITNDPPDKQKIIEGRSRESDNASQPASEHGGFFSGLFRSSSDKLSVTQSVSTQQQSKPNNLRRSSLEGKSPEHDPPLTREDSQSGILSGIFNKLRASSEEVAQSKLAPHDPKRQLQFVLNEGSSQNVPSYKQQTQLQAVVRDQKSPDSGGQSVQRTDQKSCVKTSTSLISNIFKKCPNESPSGADMEMDKETNGRAMFASHPDERNGTVINNVAVYNDDNNLDLRTLASYETSQQMNVACISNSTGRLPQMTHFPESSFLNRTKNLNSTDHLPSSPLGLTVQTPQPYITQIYPSLYNFPEQHACHNNSFYGLGPNYERYWSQNSVLREQLNNQSMSYDPWEYSHAPSLEALQELSQSLSMNVDEHQQHCSTYDWMAFKNSQENGLKQQEYHRNTANNLNVQKMWNSHNSLDMINNCGSCIEEGGALNLSKNGGAKFGSGQSFSEESCYSLNTVDYLEGYYEEHPTNLSCSANRENICPRTYRQPASNECYPGVIGSPNGWNYSSVTTADKEDSAYFEDTEWYQQWLLLLEQGMWWPADDGDCGYFVYTDHEYIYALLTDGSGQYVYACAPEDEVWGNGQMSDNYPSALLHNEMVIVCGFKIPLNNEDELFWFPGHDQSEAQLLNAPLDLSDAYKKGNEIMNLNLERFSQMFESSIPAQGQQAMDFSSYRLNKFKMDTRQQTQNGSDNPDSLPEVLDLRVNGTDCNLNNRRTKELLSQKVSISICPTPTTHSSGVYNCYQPHQRRRSSFGLQVKHIDDTSEEEWRKRVQPGEEPLKKPINKIASLFSSLVGKSQESESCRNTTCTKTFTTAINVTHPGMIPEKFDKSSVSEAQSDKEIKGILSTGLQGIKSMTINNVSSPSVTPKESTNQQTSEMRSSRILPKIPSSGSAQGATHKPKLARQVTVSQQSSSIPDSTHVPVKSVSSIDIGEKPSEQNQGGFLRVFSNAIAIEDPNQESVKSSRSVTKQTEKNFRKSVLDGVKDSSTDRGTGMTKLLGSVGELLNMENGTSQLPSKESYLQKSSAQHQSFGSRNDAEETGYVYNRTSKSEGIQKPQRQSRFSLGSQSDVPKESQTLQEQMPKNASQIFSPNVNNGLISGGSQSMPPTSCNTSEPSTKSTSGLFGFSIANFGRTNNKEETAWRGLLPSFNDSSPQQIPSQTVSASKCQVGGESAKDTTGNRILSLFGSSSTEKAALLNQTTEKAPQKERSSIGLLSVFNATSTQQTSTLHTGPSNQAASPKVVPGKNVLNVFSGPKSQQNSSSTRSTSEQTSHGIAHQDSPSTASQGTGSIFSGILGGLSTYNERPVKNLFSRLGGSSPQPSSTQQPTTVPAADTEIPVKVPPKQLKGVVLIDGAQKSQPAVSNIQEAIPQKQPPGKGLLSLFGVQSPQQNTPQATPIQSGFLSGSAGNKEAAKGLLSMFGKPSHEQNAETCLQINAQANLSPEESSVENEQSTKSSVKYMPSVSSAPTPQQPDYIDSALPDDNLPIFSTPHQASCIPFPAETPGTDLPSMLSEVHFQSNDAPHIQTCTSTEAVSVVPKDIASAVDTISVSVESTKDLPTIPICSGPEVTSQNAASGLLSMFSGSSSQNTAPQVGSVLGGIFPGTTGQKDVPGKSLFSMFSGTSSNSSSDAENHRPSASKGPPGKSLFSMFGGTSPQEHSPPASLLGGIFPGGITPKEVSGRGLLSMFGGPSPTTPSQTEETSKPPEAEGRSNISSFFSHGSTSKDVLFSEPKNLELQKSQVMRSGYSGADHKPANTVSGDGSKQVEGNEPMTLQPQSKQQNISHSITEAEKETIEGTSTADSRDIRESPSFSGQVSNTHSWPEQNEKQNLSQNESQPQPKQEDMTTQESVTGDKEGQQKHADVETSVFDTSADVVSGFMSKMFSGASGPSKTSSGLFSSVQTSFFKSTSTLGSESQQTTSIFGFPSRLPTDSLKSDLLGMFQSHQAAKPAEAVPSNLNLNCTPSTESVVQDQRVSNDIVSSSGDINLTENVIKTESGSDPQPRHQVIKPDDSITNLTPASVNPPEVPSLTGLNNEVLGSDVVMGKPVVIIGEPEDTLTDKSEPAQQPPKSEPSQSMFDMAGLSPPKLSFITQSEDARKCFGSLFSSAASKGLPTMPQTDGGGLLSGFKSFSTSLFSEQKPVASNNEPPSLFGAKIGLWQKEAPTIPSKKQTPSDVTAQPNSPRYPKSTSIETDLSLLVLKEMKENVNKIDNDIIHGTAIDLDRFEFEDQNKSIGSLDDPNLQISMSTLEIDGLSQKEQESQFQLPSSAALSSGLQQEYKELLSAKRLVAS